MTNAREEKVPIQPPPSTYVAGGCPALTIPKVWAEEIFKEYHAQYPSQSFEQLHNRGGFGYEEALMLLVQRCQRLEAQIK